MQGDNVTQEAPPHLVLRLWSVPGHSAGCRGRSGGAGKACGILVLGQIVIPLAQEEEQCPPLKSDNYCCLFEVLNYWLIKEMQPKAEEQE